MKTKKVGYTEPDNYFPKNVRKKLKLGEYATKGTENAKKSVKRTKKK